MECLSPNNVRHSRASVPASAAWTRPAGRWRPAVRLGEFRFARPADAACASMPGKSIIRIHGLFWQEH